MSLFIAVHPSVPAVEHLEDAVERVRRHPSAAGLHWQPPTRWHITMAFLGEGTEEQEQAATDVLDEFPSRAPAVDVSLSGSGAFGRQVLWVGVRGSTSTDDQALAVLATNLHRDVTRRGITLERRPWRPHLTIARARHTDARPAAPLLAHYEGPAWPIDALSLVRSEGGPSPVHTVVHRVALVSQEPPPPGA